MVLQRTILIIAVSFLAFAVACIVGWAVSIISSRLNNRSVIRVLLALVFLGAYYVFYFNINRLLGELVANAISMGESMKKALYPIYVFGSGCSGNWIHTLYFFAGASAAMGLVFWFMSKSFVSVATKNTGAKKKVFSGKAGERSSAGRALLRKEFKRYISSSAYMLNGSMGTFMMPIAAAALIIKAGDIKGIVPEMLSVLGLDSGYVALVVAAAGMFLCSMNDLTASSLSLEGNSYWILRSLPVDMKQVAKAKIGLHLILTLVPYALLLTAVTFVLGLDIKGIVLSILLPVSYILLQAYGGLAANIVFPKMEWLNETAAVKQGASVGISILGGIVLTLLTAGLYFLVLNKYIEPAIYIAAVSGVFLILAFLLRHWIFKKGVTVMDSLQC